MHRRPPVPSWCNRLVGALSNVTTEIARARDLAEDRGSFLRWSADILAYRVLRHLRLPGHNRPRTITLKGGAQLTYRLNRGDVLTLREVWIDEVYRVPGLRDARSLIDLGANIGLASVWFASRYGCNRLVAVEPLSENAVLLRHNLHQNGITASVLECAVAAGEGEGFLAVSKEPNSGRLGREGRPVRIASMSSVVEAMGAHGVDIMKIDIEGAEKTLFSGNLDWLGRVQAIVAEIHFPEVELDEIVAVIEAAGLRAMSSGMVSGGSSVLSFSRASGGLCPLRPSTDRRG